MKMVDLNHYGT